jgi:hypothetical protein
MASGLVTDWKGPSKGTSAHDSTPRTDAAVESLAHQRQRGEGSDPVGVSSKMKPRQAARGRTLPLETAAR